MDSELAALVSKFRAVQLEGVADKRINERNVVELLTTLRARGLVDILYTSDGKEFLTRPQLKREIIDEVVAHSGRINICDLPAILNVDLSLIEQAIELIVAEEASMTLLGGEIMNEAYLGAVVLDASDELKEFGCLTLADFSRRHRLPLAFASKILAESVARSEIVALLDDTALFTPNLVRRQAHVVRCALLAATTPVSLSDFCDRHRVLRQLFPKVLHHLVEAGRIPGRVEGGAGGQYIPAVFENQRTEAITNIYSSNGVVTYAMLQSHGVADPRAFMATRFNPPHAAASSDGIGVASRKGTGGAKAKARAAKSPHVVAEVVGSTDEYPLAGFSLSSCFLADRVLKQLATELESVIHGDVPLLDISERLPTAVNMRCADDEDVVVRRLEALSPALTATCVRVDGTVYVNVAAIDALKPQIEAVAREDLAQRSTSVDEAVRIRAAKGSEGPSGASRNGRKIVLLMAKALGVAADEHQAALDELLEQWSEKIDTVYREVQASLSVSSSAQALKKLRGEYAAQAVALWNDMHVWAKAMPWVQHNEHTRGDAAAHGKHLIVSLGARVVQAALLEASADKPDLHQVLAQDAEAGRTPKQQLTRFSQKEQKALQPLVAALDSSSVDAFMDQLEKLSAAGEIGVCLHAPNKRLERDTLAAVKQRVQQAALEWRFGLEDVAGNAEGFTQLCTLLLSLRCRTLLLLQGKLVGPVVAAINVVEPYPLLLDCHQSVVEMLRSGAVTPTVVEHLVTLQKEVAAACVDGS